MQTNIFFKVIFIFVRKKGDFHAFFGPGQHSVTEPGPTPSPWSIDITFVPGAGSQTFSHMAIGDYKDAR